MKYIAICGTVGSGKTTMLGKLLDHFGARASFHEERPQDNPFICDYYADSKRWTFHAQVSFLSLYFDDPAWKPENAKTELFFFDACEFDGARAVLANKRVTGVEVERTAVFPLLTPSCWGEEQPVPRRWVVLPHDRVTGRPLRVKAISMLSLIVHPL